MKTLIVIPTYNEIENLQKLVSEIFTVVDSQTHVLVLDDNSPDGTGELADELASKNPRVHVIHRPCKMGLGTAYVTGFQYALDQGYDVIIEMDSDFSHDPKYLPIFQQEIEKADAVVGSRYIPGGGVVNWGVGRKFISHGGNVYARLILGLGLQDLTGGYNCWRRSVIEAIGPKTLRSDGYAFQIEMKYKAFKNGFRIREIPIIFEDRYAGRSKMSRRIVLEAMVRVLLMRGEPLMRQILKVFALTMILCLIAPSNNNAAHTKEYSVGYGVLIVDKNAHQIHLARYSGSQIEIIKSYHATLGKALGDKVMENDLKTPEGIYFFTQKLAPPGLKKKYGSMALLTDYPNPIDRIEGKTGYDIMLHATDDPLRLKKDYDSEGCVVVDNHEVEELSKSVILGLTPIIIYPELKPEYLKEEGLPEVKEAFAGWLEAWKAKDIEKYIGSYVNAFRYNGMSLKQYREYKKSLNARYKRIKVDAENVRYFFHPKYNVVEFTQNYESELSNGRKGFVSSGTKLVYFVKDGDGHFKIATEMFTSQRL